MEKFNKITFCLKVVNFLPVLIYCHGMGGGGARESRQNLRVGGGVEGDKSNRKE